MARPEKKTVEYFPFVAKNGKTLFILEDKYGCKGTGFFTNVLRFLAETPDHHFSIHDETDRMMFFARTKCDEESGIDMLNIMAKTGKIHLELWISCQAIASSDFIESIQDAYKNRKNQCITLEEVIQKYIPIKLITEETEFPGEETTLSYELTVDSEPINTQTILEETRVKEKKLEKRGNSPTWTLKDIIKMFDAWNRQDLPKYPEGLYKTGVNIKDSGEILNYLKSFNKIEISQAIRNYAKIRQSSDHELKPEYGDALGFFKAGIHKYYEDADPFKRCLKSGKIEKKKIDDKRQKNRPSHCKQCETEINEKNTKISISTMQCRECKTIYKWNGHEWIIDK